MVNVSNPNFKSKNRVAARAAKRKGANRRAQARPRDRVGKADARVGARPGLLPTSGPRAKISSKKARKLEKKMRYALSRKMEAEGEVVMRDAPKQKKKGQTDDAAAKMDLDDEIL